MNNDTLTSVNSGETISQVDNTLEHVLNIMPALILWLIRSGISHSEFSTALKALFYNEAIKELDHIQQKKTDSAISLLSGLNRRDIRHFCQTYGEYTPLQLDNIRLPISVPARVVALWSSEGLPQRLPMYGDEPSFEYLVKQISSDKHPKSILLELKRLGIAQEMDDHVILQSSGFSPDPKADESKQLFTQNASDHLYAGINNLTQYTNFLEQAVFADELSPESVKKLNQLSKNLWEMMREALVMAALDYCKNDEGKTEANQHFRVGIYQYYQ